MNHAARPEGKGEGERVAGVGTPLLLELSERATTSSSRAQGGFVSGGSRRSTQQGSRQASTPVWAVGREIDAYALARSDTTTPIFPVFAPSRLARVSRDQPLASSSHGPVVLTPMGWDEVRRRPMKRSPSEEASALVKWYAIGGSGGAHLDRALTPLAVAPSDLPSTSAALPPKPPRDSLAPLKARELAVQAGARAPTPAQRSVRRTPAGGHRAKGVTLLKPLMHKSSQRSLNLDLDLHRLPAATSFDPRLNPSYARPPTTYLAAELLAA